VKAIQVIVTRNQQGGVSVAANPAAPPRDPFELLGLLDLAKDVVRSAVLQAPGPQETAPGIAVVTGPAAEAIARDARVVKP
jgi:hypothetical protein